MNKVKELMEKLAALRLERTALFNTMTESFKDEDVKAYEDKVKEIQQVEYALTEAERIEKEGSLDEGAQKAIEDNKNVIDDEAKNFVQKLKEAIAVGTTYTSLVPTTVASQIVKKREQFGKLRVVVGRWSLPGITLSRLTETR